MTTITLIGAGSKVFARNLCNDLLLTPSLAGVRLVLMDIDPVALAETERLVEQMIEHRGVQATVEATTDRRAALTGTDVVITTFQHGGLDAYRLDITIPQRYGVEQCVGDTLGPGGVFRALRTIPVLVEIARELDEVAPDALMLNYVNPMSANCWATTEATGRPVVGLCHSVQGTSEMLASWCDVPYEELRFLAAGINHQAFFLELRHHATDLYPRLRDVVTTDRLRGAEPVRIELMESLGYFVTESSGHASEYVPWFRKDARMVEHDLVPRFREPSDAWFDFGRTGGYLRHCETMASPDGATLLAHLSAVDTLPDHRSHEYGSWIIEAIVTDRPITVNANVTNHGSIENLPARACVEVPCLVDGNGVSPTRVGPLPTQLAVLNKTAIGVQELVVEAALTGSRDAVHHAVMMDPLTGAACTLSDIHRMVDELLVEQAPWLPTFT